jgi:cyanophycinase
MILFKSLSIGKRSVTMTLLLSFLACSSAWAQEKLILIGGGAGRPSEALKQFGDWAGQEKGKILIITWGSAVPKETSEDLLKDFVHHFKGRFLLSLTAPVNNVEQNLFLEQLRSADGVFFSGGDQAVTMNTFKVPGGQKMLKAIERAYASGKVFGGTSAGTAIMSKFMITGKVDNNGNVPIDFGLGFIPDHILLDQHFSQRDRAGRLLLALLQTQTKYAIGIDEDTAMIIMDKARVRIVGENDVHIYSGNRPGQFKGLVLSSGDNMWLPADQ